MAKDCPKKAQKGAGKGRQGWKICHHFSETGKCPHKEKYGYCRFAHVRLPAKLQAIKGLVFEDVAGAASYDGKEGSYHVADDAPIKENLATLVAQEMAELGEFSFDEEESCCHPSPEAGFGGHRR